MDGAGNPDASEGDHRSEIQRVRTSRGGMSYDLRPFGHDRGYTARTKVFYGIDSRYPKRSDGRAPPSYQVDSTHPPMANHDLNSLVDRPVSPIPMERSMPHLSRRESDSTRSRTSMDHPGDVTMYRSSPQVIALDERRAWMDSFDNHPDVDEPHLRADPRPQFGGGVESNADRPRAREPNDFGKVSSQLGRDERRYALSREDALFSDTPIIPM